MLQKNILVLAVMISVGASQVVFADDNHGNGATDQMETMSDMGSTPQMGMDGDNTQMGNMGDNMIPMMQMMMQMHQTMMKGGGQMGLMNGDGRMRMMDRDMMGMMMPGVDPQNIAAHMNVKLREFDTDADSALTLDEFEALHAEAIRDQMVDRFQHIDANGDGQITQEEMTAAGTRMGTMIATNGSAGTAGHHSGNN
jgi:Ca2+-binding EF-hand superfamily protein